MRGVCGGQGDERTQQRSACPPWHGKQRLAEFQLPCLSNADCERPRRRGLAYLLTSLVGVAANPLNITVRPVTSPTARWPVSVLQCVHHPRVICQPLIEYPQSHSQCSESFYKKEVELEIKSQPSKTPQERLKMMELLKKFEEEDAELASENQSDADDLAARLEGVNIGIIQLSFFLYTLDNGILDSASANVLWSKLSPQEQAEFLKIMDDPSSRPSRQLLTSQELENERCEPWWEAVAADLSHSRQRFGPTPRPIQIPPAMSMPIPNGKPLHYNMCAIWWVHIRGLFCSIYPCTFSIAYSYTTRHLSTSPLSAMDTNTPDFLEARHLLSQLVPFVTDRKSTTLYSNVSSLTTDMWSRFQPVRSVTRPTGDVPTYPPREK